MNLVVLTNILTPYRIPLFEEIAKRVDQITVLVMAESHDDRDWSLEQYDFKVLVIPGKQFNKKKDLPLFT